VNVVNGGDKVIIGLCVCVSVCPRSYAVTVTILDRFWWNLALTSGTWNERTFSLGWKSN